MMRRTNMLLLAFVSTLSGGCGSDSDLPASADETVSPPGVTVLSGGRRLLSGDALGIPIAMSLIGDRLVVIDGAADPFLHIVDPSSGELLRFFGRRGEGPGEFGMVWAVYSVPGATEHAWAFDLTRNRLTKISLSDSVEAGPSSATVVSLIEEAVFCAPRPS